MLCVLQGFNCAEAVNFALEDWVSMGRRATQCTCSALEDAVRLDVRLFKPKARRRSIILARAKHVPGATTAVEPSAGL